MRKITLNIMVILLFSTLLIGCSKEISYYDNPNKIEYVDNDKVVEIEGYKLSIKDSVLTIDGENSFFEVELPYNERNIISFQLSHNKEYLAYDVKGEDGKDVFVVNLLTGDIINIADYVESYDKEYDKYEPGHGIAWSPNKNIIAFIEGSDNAVEVNLLHLEMDSNKQSHGGSFAFEEIYGVKWDEQGDYIYYVVPSKDEHSTYQLYRTKVHSENYLQGTSVEKIGQLTQKEYEEWFKE